MNDEAAAKLPPMPPEIAKAVIAVKRKIERIGKDETNTFAKFKYTSVDAFYEAVGPIMAEAGLFDLVQERSMEVTMREVAKDNGDVRKSLWLTGEYDIWMYHESGAQFGPIPRTIIVPATGPQAFGSGQSYVEKYFLRALFKIPTGDADADSERQEGVPTQRQTRQEYTPWANWFKGMLDLLDKVDTAEKLAALLAREKQNVNNLLKQDHRDAATLRDKIATTSARIEAAAPEPEPEFEWTETDGEIAKMDAGKFAASMLLAIEKATDDRMDIIWEMNSGLIAKLPEKVAMSIRDAMDARAQAKASPAKEPETVGDIIEALPHAGTAYKLAYGPEIDLAKPGPIPVPPKTQVKGEQPVALSAAIMHIADLAPFALLGAWYTALEPQIMQLGKINPTMVDNIKAVFQRRHEAQTKA